MVPKRKFVWSILDKVFVSVTTFLPSLIVASFYSVSSYGEYFYCFSLAVLISSVSVLIDDKVLKKYYLTRHSRPLLQKAGYVRLIAMTIAGTLVLTVRHMFITQESTLLIALFLTNFIVIAWGYSLIVELQSKLALSKLAKVNGIYSILITASYLVISVMQFDVTVLIVSCIIISMIRNLALGWLVKRNFSFEENKISNIKIIDVIKESVPFGIAAIAYILYSRMDTMMIKYYLNSEEVAIYSIAIQIVAVSTLFMIPIQIIAFPGLKEAFKFNGSYYSLIVKYTRLGIISYAIIFCLAAVTLFVVSTVFDSEYSESLQLLKLLFFSGLIVALSCLRSTHITLLGIGSFLLKTQSLALVLNFALNFFLIPRFGLDGAAIATLSAQVMSLIVSNFFRTDLREYFFMQMKAINLLNNFYGKR